MPNTDQYVTSRFKLTATIGGITFNDIVSFSSTFGLNTIPIASMVVATGYEVSSGEPATIHSAKEQLKAGDEAVVTLTIINSDGATNMMESGTMTIFRGKFAGIGYKRSYNSASYTIHLIHWLDNLNHGSMVNGNWFPGAPYDMAQNAGYYALSATEGDAGYKYSPLPAIDMAGEIVNGRNISADFWGLVLKPIFEKIIAWPLPRYQSDTKQNSAEQMAPVLDALTRMSASGPGKDWYAPLSLNLAGLSSSNVGTAVKSAITKDALDSFAYTTMWNKLVGDYAPQFFFAISPAVDFALAVPFFAGLKLPYKRITAAEYNYADLNASMLQQLESVDVFYSVNGDSGYSIGGTSNNTGRPSFKLPLGFYPPGDLQNKRGFKMLKEPPGWMTNIFPATKVAGRATGVLDNTAKTVTNPAEGSSDPPPGYNLPEKYQVEQQKSDACMRLAEHWYKTEVLSQRYGEMSGKLRFDIAPGSVVAIETAPTALEPYDLLFATVTQVAFAIDAERAAAGTSFTLAHIRTSTENDDPTLTSEQSPLYAKSVWKGAPLAVVS